MNYHYFISFNFLFFINFFKKGETMLAFFKAKNLSDTPVIGVSTYNVVPLVVKIIK